jgi:hypothetical protein
MIGVFLSEEQCSCSSRDNKGQHFQPESWKRLKQKGKEVFVLVLKASLIRALNSRMVT